ncbi:APC family permease [Corynebacterium kalidii]|uniref:APC family permease n=1 Tax=Corynebacterium kalidii TaxID=2931982 RepID=A0A9X2B1Y6_9CORY|nr:APC family permease [Corynebacterium kalidii]MCJ7858165.1 APC family permease [Corynebacterium kalidii]
MAEHTTHRSITGDDTAGAPALRRGRLSTASLVFIIIAASAPLTVLAGGIPTAFSVSGLLGAPLAYVALGVILVLFAVGYGRMSSRIQNSGAFYAYISEGLGNRQGIAAAILALVSYNMMQIGLYGMFGFSAAAAVSGWTGLDVPWWVAGATGWVIVAVLGVNKIDLSAKVIGVLVVLEFLVVIAVSGLSLGHAPEGITAQGLLPDQFFTAGIGVLLAFSIAAFMGFESGAIYSEETRDPERTVPRATYIAVGVIAVFYAFSAWALATGVGPGKVIEEATTYGPDLVFVWLAERSPVLSDIATVLFVTSLIAALLAFHNAAARYFFSLGRAGVIPRVFARSGTNGAPVAGSLTQSALSLLVVAVFAVAGLGSDLGDLYPVLTLFTWLTNAAAFGLVFLLTVTGVAILVWSSRQKDGAGVFTRVVAPLVSSIGLAVVAVLILANFDLMIDGAGPEWLVYVMPGVIIATGLGSLVWGEVLRRIRPATYAALQDNLDQVPD